MSEVIRSKRGQAVLISLHKTQTPGRMLWHLASERGLSSAGRASALQAEGHRFDPDRLHQGLRPALPVTAVDAARARRVGSSGG